jgi:hypothetical protein
MQQMMISEQNDEVRSSSTGRSWTRDDAQGTEAGLIKIAAGKLVTIVSFNKILNNDT